VTTTSSEDEPADPAPFTHYPEEVPRATTTTDSQLDEAAPLVL
jgi:hypothetical protein